MKLRTIGVIGFYVMVFVIIIFVIEELKVKLEFLGGLIIGVLSAQLLPAWKYLSDKNQVNPKIFPYPSKHDFHAGIFHYRERYIRGSVNIKFESEYTGKLKNGYFVNEIFFPENNGMNTFSHTMSNLSNDTSSTKSYCLATIDIPNSKKGKLNGCREFSYTWDWEIPHQDDMPLGTYNVKYMVFNENKEHPLETTNDSFEVINMTNNSQIGGRNIQMPKL